MKDASHLSLLEHGVYMRLLDVYYTREAPIPVDQAARLIGARTDEEKATLTVIAGEFFKVVDGCYTQARCDIEISMMLSKAESNRVVGAKGGRPKKETATVSENNPDITQMVSENNPDITLATSHKPVTNNHKETKTQSASALLSDCGISAQISADFLAIRKSKKLPLTKTALSAIDREAGKAGIALEAALQICCEKGWAAFNSAWDWKSDGRQAGRADKFDPLAYINRDATTGGGNGRVIDIN